MVIVSNVHCLDEGSGGSNLLTKKKLLKISWLVGYKNCLDILGVRTLNLFKKKSLDKKQMKLN